MVRILTYFILNCLENIDARRFTFMFGTFYDQDGQHIKKNKNGISIHIKYIY